MSKLHYSYHKDLKNPNRVLTLVYRYHKDDPKKLEYAYCVNNTRATKVIDRFSRKVARQLSSERLNYHPFCGPVVANERPMMTIMKWLSNYDNMPQCVQKIAVQWLDDYDRYVGGESQVFSAEVLPPLHTQTPTTGMSEHIQIDSEANDIRSFDLYDCTKVMTNLK